MKEIAYIITAASVVGTVANSFKKRWCFIVWGVTNTFWIFYNITFKNYAQAILYAFNLIMAIVGFIKWRDKPSTDTTPKRLKKIFEIAENALSDVECEIDKELRLFLSEFVERKSKKNAELALGRPIKKIKQIEKALGFQLTEWQKAFIFEGQPYDYGIATRHRNGKTTAHCLRLCLSEGMPIIASANGMDIQQFYGENGIGYKRRKFFINELRNIYETLHNAGIETRKIVFVYTMFLDTAEERMEVEE